MGVKKGLKNVAFKLLWQHLEHKLQDILNVWNIYSIRVTKFQVQMIKVKVSFVHQEDKVSLKCKGKTRILIPKSSIGTSKSERHFVLLKPINIFPKQTSSKNTTNYKILELELRCVMMNFPEELILLIPLVVSWSHLIVKISGILYLLS